MDTEKELFTGRRLAGLVLPLIIEQLLGITVGIADSVMVSSAGEAAVSGVSLVDTISVLLINTFASLATGGAVVAAHRLGEKQGGQDDKTPDQLLLCVTGISVIVMLLSLIGNRWVLSMIYGNVEQQVMSNAVIYFYITALSFPFLGIYNACAALSRAMGNSKVTMKLSLLMNGVNVAGNAILIYGFHAGIAGAAISTLAVRILGAVIMFFFLRDQEKPLHFTGRLKIRPDKVVIRKILQVGVPTGLDSCIFQVGKIIVQSMIAGFGTASITANAIAGMAAGIAVIPASSVGIAMITVVGQAAGRGDRKEAAGYVKRLMAYAYAGMAAVNILMILLAPGIAGLYSVSGEAAGIAVKLIIFHSLCAAVLWPTGFALPNALRAAYDATFTMVVSIGSMWLFRIGLSYLLGVTLGLGVFGIWAAMAIDWFFRSLCFIWRIVSGRWMKGPAHG